MTDEELMSAPEVKDIARHLKNAIAAVNRLEQRSGRSLSIFVEAEAGPMLIDNAHDSEGFGRLNDLVDGGSVVYHFSNHITNWSCGAR